MSRLVLFAQHCVASLYATHKGLEDLPDVIQPNKSAVPDHFGRRSRFDGELAKRPPVDLESVHIGYSTDQAMQKAVGELARAGLPNWPNSRSCRVSR